MTMEGGSEFLNKQQWKSERFKPRAHGLFFLFRGEIKFENLDAVWRGIHGNIWRIQKA
jgi:hypothetical protein